MVMTNAKPLTPPQAADLIEARTGHRPSPTTVWRWCQAFPGLAVRIGDRHLLKPAAVEMIAAGTPIAVAVAQTNGEAR